MEEIEEWKTPTAELSPVTSLGTNPDSPTLTVDEKLESNHQGTPVEEQSPIPVIQDDLTSLPLEQPNINSAAEPDEVVPTIECVVSTSPEVEDINSPVSSENSNIVNNVSNGSENGIFINATEFQIDEESCNLSEVKTEDTVLSVASNDFADGQAGEGLSNKMPASPNSSEEIKRVNVYRDLVDTAAPFESVKEAVSKFGGIVDWKAHKAQTMERRRIVQLELEKVQEEIPQYKKQSEAAEDAKAQVLKELSDTKRLIEELKLSLEKAQTEEAQAKQDSELVQLRVKEMEQGIASEASVAAKAQVDVAKSRHAAAVAELKSVKEELKAMQEEYTTLVAERDNATKRAEEAVSASRNIEKTVEELTLELITAKEALESAHAAHMEAEDHRIGAALARDQDMLNWEKELKQAENELQHLTEKLLSMKDLQSKLDTASTLLHHLKGELAAYMEAKLSEEGIEEDKWKVDTEEGTKTHAAIQAAVAATKKEIEEVKSNIEKAKEEVKCLKVAAVSLKAELENERAALDSMRQREGMASIAVTSLESELNRTTSEIDAVLAKEKEARNQMLELPKALQQAAHEAEEAKLEAWSAQEELRRATDEAEQMKATASTIQSRLNAALKEIEAAKVSERLALAAVKALQESEQAASMDLDDSNSRVAFPLEEYYTLSKEAHDAEEQANERVAASISQIEVAKESHLKSLDKLAETQRELAERKEALRLATEKAEKAKQGKLGAEQELRKWRAESEQRRKAASVASQAAVNLTKSPQRSFEESDEAKSFVTEQESPNVAYSTSSARVYMPANSTINLNSEGKVKKKKSLLPRIIMFLSRKKTQGVN